MKIAAESQSNVIWKFLFVIAALIVAVPVYLIYLEIRERKLDLKSVEQLTLLKQKGWLPEWLPDTVTAFYEAHDLDTNQGISSFAADEVTTDSIRANCIEVTAEELDLPRGSFLITRTWWSNADIKNNVANGNWKLYQCVSERGYRFFLTADANRVYLWIVGQAADVEKLVLNNV